MRLIDADELIKCIPLEEYNSRFAVMNAPTIEPQSEIVYCKDCKKHNFGIGDYIMDGKETVWIWKPDACPLVQFRGYAQGHEFDYQHCCYGEKKGDSE